MKRLALYSVAPEPELLLEYGGSSSFGGQYLGDIVGVGDRPLDLLIDTSNRMVVWTFVAEHRGEQGQAGYYIAEFQDTTITDLFQQFDEALHSLRYNDDWALPHSGGPRLTAGRRLWRLSPHLSELTEPMQERLFEHLRSGGEYLEFQMKSYQSALQAAKAIYEEDMRCTVAIDGEQRDEVPENVDLLFRPTGDTDFDPVSQAARAVIDPSHTEEQPAEVSDGGMMVDIKSVQRISSLPVAVTTATVLGLLLGLALYSFVSVEPVHPITGLATIGGFLGALVAFPGMTALVLGESEASQTDVVTGSYHTLRDQTPIALLTVTYGTVLAFIYPTAFRVAGTVIGSQWVFGPVSSLLNAIVSAAVFAAALACATWFVTAKLSQHDTDRDRIAPIMTGHAIYAFGLIVATGLATGLWYQLIPAV